MQPDSTGTGLRKETSAALSYLLGPLTGIIFLILEKDTFVRFHAIQSIIVFTLFLFVVPLILQITIILRFLISLDLIIAFILWLVLIYKAFNAEAWEVPVLGSYAKQFLGKL
ncbi:hypothetical protein HY045_01100 [Candidatus Woesebacteria bacterium]|nr:hypothetical protein [Candidatus Woesebacteria bacterium]